MRSTLVGLLLLLFGAGLFAESMPLAGVLEQLKTSRETAHVPVIICSIGVDEARALSLGAAAYLSRPVLEKDLLQAMALAAKLQSI